MRGRPRSSTRLWVEECASVGIANSTRRTSRLSRSQPTLEDGLIDRSLEIVTSDASGLRDAQRVRVTVTHPHFGGTRCWYVCPRCGLRAGKLYALDVGVLGCRVCLNLVYRCQYRKDLIWARCVRLFS